MLRTLIFFGRKTFYLTNMRRQRERVQANQRRQRDRVRVYHRCKGGPDPTSEANCGQPDDPDQI